MPIYEFVCSACGKRVEYFVQTRTWPRLLCSCGAKMEKVPSAPAIHFKGSGFYKTDYGKPAKER